MATDAVALVDGVVQDPTAAAVAPTDPGLLGQGVYESIRTYDGVPFAVERHLDRLAVGAAALGIDPPAGSLADEVHAAVAARGGDGETRIRLILTAGGRRLVIADRLPDRRREREQGLAVVSLPWRRDPAGPTAGIKAASTAATRVAQAYVAERGAATGLWLTPAGNVSEALAANVFAVCGATLVTPPLSDGALAGVTRAELLECAAAGGLEVAERALPVRALATAAEAFLSATSEPVVPLVALDGAPIGDGTPGPQTERLQALFDLWARSATQSKTAAKSRRGSST